jgi:Xaa-Pro aminopeptidase
MSAAKILEKLRNALAEQGLAAYLQPVHDEYMNEYAPPCNRRVEWLCGFTGSAGAMAVTAGEAALFVDGRYTLQAKNEVNATLFEQHNSAALMPEAWLAERLKRGDKTGYDPRLYTRDMVSRITRVLEAKGIALVPVANLVDAIWKERPAAPATPLFVHDIAYSGEASSDKRQRIAAAVTAAGADVAVISAPDSVCWLLNVRARDIENTPLLLATALIDSQGEVQLFADPARCNAEVSAHLGNHVELCLPESLPQRLEALGKAKSRVLCDPQALPVWFSQHLGRAGAVIIEGRDPCVLPKAMKNKVELQGIRNAHQRDGVAVSKLLCWLEGAGDVTELEVCEKLHALRALHPMFVEPSFHTISGSGPHGAIVHYRATSASNRKLRQGELFLLDSGGQYPDGTTDITRTIIIGVPTQEHRDRYTRVLKGHIAIATARFPDGTSGSQLDALARQYLWQAGLDYDHGTGHGVGCFLNVHEGPQRISKRGGDAALKPGMIVSNEPGYYKDGEYGIRIENLVAVTQSAQESSGKIWLAFETITCVPFDARLIDATMLDEAEKSWLNHYHAWVLESLKVALEPAERPWLEKRCAAV